MKLKGKLKSFVYTVALFVVAALAIVLVAGLIKLTTVLGPVVPAVFVFGIFWYMIHNDLRAWRKL